MISSTEIFLDRLDGLIETTRETSDISYAEAIGSLMIVILDMYAEIPKEGDDDEVS